jgi:LemA protein
MSRSLGIGLGCVVVLLLVGLVGGCAVMGTYNSLVGLDQEVLKQWGQVENQYQRRADLIPNLVETVKGVANFEKDTYVAVSEARASAGKVTAEGLQNVVNDPAAFERFEQAQGALSSALSRLMAVVENYPDLKASQNFRDLQVQLEGTENRIAVERMRFNEAAQAFNVKRKTFPNNVIANFFGSRFNEKPFFKAKAGAEVPPKVEF